MAASQSSSQAIEARQSLAEAFDLEAADKPGEALTSIERVLHLAPDLAEAYNLKGIVLEQLQRQDEAVAAYRDAIRLAPDFQDAQTNLRELLDEVDEIRHGHKGSQAVKLDNSAVNARPSFDWRLFLVLSGLTIFASIILTPYSLMLIGVTRIAFNFALAGYVGVQVLGAIIIYCPLIAVGLIVASRIGLGAPLLAGWLGHNLDRGQLKKVLAASLTIGMVTGVATLVLGLFVLTPWLQAVMPSIWAGMFRPPSVSVLVNGLLAAISAGINEELLCRLFLFSVLAWLGNWISRQPLGGPPSRVALWAANVGSAIVFSLLHLINLAQTGAPINAVTILFVLAANGGMGLAFGWLYWTYGLESAMLGHFFVGVVLHVIGPLVGQGFS